MICCIINLFGAAIVGNASSVLSVLTLFPFAIFTLFALISKEFEPKYWFDIEQEQEWNINLYISVLIWATCGYEYSGFLAENTERPQKTLPIVMGSTVVLMTLTYLIPIAMGIATYPNLHEVSEGAYPIIANNLGFGEWLGYTMIGGGLASTMGTYIAYLQTTAVALFEMSKEGRAPAFFSYFRQYNTPVVCIIFYSLTTIILTLATFELLVEVETVLYSLHTAIFASCIIKLRYSQPDLERPFKLLGGKPFVIIIAMIPIVVALLNIVLSRLMVIMISSCIVVMIALCAVILFFMRRRRE